MKTAISIPDDLFDDAERLAQELNKSRSRLYGDAVREYVARHSAKRVTETLDRVCAEAGPGGRVHAGGGAPQAGALRLVIAQGEVWWADLASRLARSPDSGGRSWSSRATPSTAAASPPWSASR